MGLSTGGKRRRGVLGWDDFVEAVGEAAGAKRGRYGAGPVENLTLAGDVSSLWPAARVCAFVRKDGTRCKSWPMRGARHCAKHGGYRDVPEHPATIRLYRTGQIAEHGDERRASQDLQAYTPQDRQTIKNIIKGTGAQRRRATARLMIEGLKAMHTDDAGVTWRRWLDTLKAGES
jgi:hypothetical protein